MINYINTFYNDWHTYKMWRVIKMTYGPSLDTRVRNIAQYYKTLITM